jgi:hypothetical protein
MSKLPEIEIFRVGDLTDSAGVKRTFTADDLDKIASAYSADNPAPLVVGHPKDDSPAYGWVDGLRRVGDKLFARIKDASETFVSAVREGSYKRISVALFGPDHGSNPTPGQFTLRHVGFLGGAAPAVPGLKPVNFAGSDPDNVITFELQPEAKDQAVPVNFISPTKEPAMPEPKEPDSSKELADAKAKIAEYEAAEEQRLADAKDAREREDAEFVAECVKDGRILAVDKEPIIALFKALPEDEITFSVDGSDKTQAPRDFMRSLFDKAQSKIIFEALSPTGEPNGPPRTAAEFSAAADAMIEHAKKDGKVLTRDQALEALEKGDE